MYRKIKDFLNDWEQEFVATQSLLSNISDENLLFTPSDKIRPIGDLVWHIIGTPGTLVEEMGISNNMLNWYSPQPASAKMLIEAYTQANDELTKITSKWTDAELDEEVTVLGGTYKKGYVLSSLLIGHQSHHRGQLTVLMRLRNLKVTELYGPTYESWIEMGEEPMK